MSQKFKDTVDKYHLDGIILLIIGLFMLLWPQASLKILCVLIGIVLIISGGLTLYNGWKMNDLKGGKLASGIIQIVLGILLIILSWFFVSVILILAGLVLIARCVVLFMRAWQQRYERGADFVISLVIAVIILILGIIMIVNPAGTAAFVAQLAGIALMIIGLAAIFMPKQPDQGN